MLRGLKRLRRKAEMQRSPLSKATQWLALWTVEKEWQRAFREFF